MLWDPGERTEDGSGTTGRPTTKGLSGPRSDDRRGTCRVCKRTSHRGLKPTVAGTGDRTRQVLQCPRHRLGSPPVRDSVHPRSDWEYFSTSPTGTR